MEWVGWGLLLLALLWHHQGMKLSHRKRLNLRNYVIYLLVDDSIRKDHKTKFESWIRESLAKDALELSSGADSTVENMADILASEGDSTIGAHALLWNSEAARSLRE